MAVEVNVKGTHSLTQVVLTRSTAELFINVRDSVAAEVPVEFK